jgi:prevent-host-death family protein
MDKTVSATYAKRRLSALLRAVQGGRSYQVTLRCEPIAKIVPVEKYS